MKMRIGWAMVITGTVVFGVACMALPPDYRVESGSPKFGYEAPQTVKQPRGDLTLAIVRPVQAAASTVFGVPLGPTSVAHVAPRISVTVGHPMRGYSVTEPEVRHRIAVTLQSFLDAARVDIEKLFIAKGLKTMGPFADIGEMTFSQKRDATFALAPEIHLRLDQSGGAEGELSADGWFSLILVEPLSGQKIWVKKLELDSKRARYTAMTSTSIGLAIQDVTTDDRAKVAADLLSQLYQDLMGRIWQHADPEEFATLIAQAMELKERAAPGMTTPTTR